MSFDRLKINKKSYYNLPNSAFWGWLSVESQPKNPEFSNNLENFHPHGSEYDFYFIKWSEKYIFH